MDDNLKQNIEEFNEKGYTIIKNVFNEKDFLEQINKIENIIDNSKNQIDIYYEKDGTTIKKIEKLLFNNKELRIFFEKNEIISSFMKQIFNDDFILFKDKLNLKYAKKGSGWKMHVDGVFYSDTSKKGWWDYATKFINILIPFSESKKENGTLEIVNIDKDNCSYEQLLENTDKEENNGVPKQELYKELEKKTKYLELNMTDIAFFDPRCYHTSKKNRSNKDRKIFYLTYNKLTDGDNYLKYITDKKKSSHLGDHKGGDWAKISI